MVQVVNSTGGLAYVWTGDRWQQVRVLRGSARVVRGASCAPTGARGGYQAPDGIKGHDPQFWVPLSFREDGSIEEMSWVDSFTMDVGTP